MVILNHLWCRYVWENLNPRSPRNFPLEHWCYLLVQFLNAQRVQDGRQARRRVTRRQVLLSRIVQGIGDAGLFPQCWSACNEVIKHVKWSSHTHTHTLRLALRRHRRRHKEINYFHQHVVASVVCRQQAYDGSKIEEEAQDEKLI